VAVAVTGECVEFAVQGVVAVVPGQGVEQVELDDGQLPRDGSSDQQCAGSPCVSLRSSDGGHRGEWGHGREGWLCEMYAHQGEHESHHWLPFWKVRSPVPIRDGASLRTAADRDCLGVRPRGFGVTGVGQGRQQP
jgi:hypothetical protein